MDCQKLSREACAHAAQNDRLPVQTVVQVLYYEQQRLREVMDINLTGTESSPALALKQTADTSPNEISSLKKENQDLKLELVKMRMKLKEIERSSDTATKSSSAASSPLGITHSSSDKPPLPRKSFISSVSKKLGRINPFIRIDGVLHSNPKAKNKPNKDRRHSIS